MIRRTAGLIAALAVVTSQAPAIAADTLLHVTIDGRPLTASAVDTGAILHRNVAYVDVVQMIKALNGLVVFGKANGAETAKVTLPKETIDFTVGSATYQIENGGSVRMAGAAFQINGNFYVPVGAFATLSGLAVHRRGTLLALGLPPAPLPTVAPAATANPADDQPSPAQALSVKPSAAADSSGLHMTVNITNTTANPYVLAFPTGSQVLFIVERNGNGVYNSINGKAVVQTETSLSFAPNETKTFTDTWSGYGAAGAGRYTLRVRLLTAQPIDFPPVSLGIASPSPAAT